MRGLPLVALLAVALGLAGCSSGGGDGDDGDDDGGSPSGPGGANPSSSPPGSPPGSSSSGNHAPTARIEVRVPASGGLVDFTVDGNDLDDDPLTWSLDFGDGSANFSGTELPMSLNHTYEPGSYLANLTVHDGTASTHATATLGVAAGAKLQTVDGTYVAGFEGCAAAAYDQAGTDAGAPAGSSTNGVTRIQFAVEPLTIGLPYTAAFTFDQGYLYVSVDFFASSGALLSSDNTGQTPNFGSITFEGVVPDGAVTAVLFACAGPTSASVHYEA